ncbi:MAG TPA: lysylphosphatidylglycerol synthase transmembrane domain-containing protein [Nitrospiria bacterium]|nr:lysylphosphatidylglycerol synthase transmembrane domain-containing protein [Nitrospiria bacterium]
MFWPQISKIDSSIPASSKFRQRLTTAVKAIVSLGLLIYLFSKIDVGSVGRVLQNLHPGYFALAWISFFGLQFVGVFRWRIMVRLQGFEHPFGRLASYYFVGLFFNLFLPTSIGGDLGKCYYLAESRGDILRAVTTVLADRISGMIALLCIASIALLTAGSVIVPAWMTFFTVAGTVLLILGLLIPFIFPRLLRRYELPYRYWENPRFMAASLAVSFFIQFSVVIISMIIGQAVDVVIPWESYFVFIPLVTVAGMIPVSLNGLGVREGAYVYFLAQVGVAAHQALAFAVLWLILITSLNVLGGLGWVLISRPLNAVKT